MRTALRSLYLASVLAWIGYVLAYPPWQGVIYRDDFGNGPRAGGSMHLSRDDAPLWDPPHFYFPYGPRPHVDHRMWYAWETGTLSDIPLPNSIEIWPELHWPWQAKEPGEFVEISLAGLTYRWGSGLVVAGLACGGLYWLVRRGKPDLVLEVAWALGLTLLVAGVVFWLVMVFTMGYAGSGSAPPLFLIGTVSGCLLGVWSWRSGRQPRPIDGPISSREPRGLRVGKHLSLFVLGLLAAVPLLYLALPLIEPLRGRVIGSTPMSVSHANDQGANIVGGLGLALIGVALATLAWRMGLRWLGVGLFVGTTLLGITLSLWH